MINFIFSSTFSSLFLALEPFGGGGRRYVFFV